MGTSSLVNLADTMATLRRRLVARRRPGEIAIRTLEGDLEEARQDDRILDLVDRLRHEKAQS